MGPFYLCEERAHLNVPAGNGDLSRELVQKLDHLGDRANAGRTNLGRSI